MKTLVMSLILALNLGAASVQAEVFPSRSHSTIVKALWVTPLSAGINPDAFAYYIVGDLLAGINDCDALGARVYFEQKQIGDVIHVLPRLRQQWSFDSSYCSREFLPVYEAASIEIRGLSSSVSEIIIHDVEHPNTEVTVSDYLASDELEQGISGILRRFTKVSPESTGVAIETDGGELVEIDLATNGFDGMTKHLAGRAIVVKGYVMTVPGIEVASRKVLVVQSLEQL